MILYLVRHAVAMEREDWDSSDESRPLTDEGAERMREAARGLARTGLAVDRILSSPFTRARQTADILAKELDRPKPVLTDALACGCSGVGALRELAELKSDESVMLVGHEPDLGHLAAFFLGAARPLPFKKGAMMAIEFECRAGQGKGRILWYLPTKLIRRLT